MPNIIVSTNHIAMDGENVEICCGIGHWMEVDPDFDSKLFSITFTEANVADDPDDTRFDHSQTVETEEENETSPDANSPDAPLCET